MYVDMFNICCEPKVLSFLLAPVRNIGSVYPSHVYRGKRPSRHPMLRRKEASLVLYDVY